MVIKLSDYRTMGEEENLSLREIMASETAVAFDNCTQIAIHIAQAPIAYISFIDASCQWLKSQVGLQAKTHHYLDFCERVIALHYTSRQTAKSPQPETPTSTETGLSTSEEMLSAIIIEDLGINNSINKQLATHPLVKSDPGIRFYIGIPIQTNEGVLVGMLSVMDYEPRRISTDSLNALEAISRQVFMQMDLHRQLIHSKGKLIKLEDTIKKRSSVWEIVRQERDFVCNVLNTLSALVVVLDPQGKIIRFNHICEELTGYSAQEVEGKTPQEVGLSIYNFPVQTQPLSSNSSETDQFPSQSESEWIAHDRSHHLIAWSNTIIYSPDGTIEHIIATGTDITLRRESEKMLRLLERAIAASPNGIVISDARIPEKPIIYCNPTFERITGYSSSDILGKNCRFLQGNDTDPEAISIIRACLKEAKDCLVTLKNYRKDGTAFWNELAISPVRDAEGKVTHFIGIQTDISERKRAEEALKTSEERYRLLAENATDLISRHSSEGIYLYASPACRKLLKYEPEQLIGHSAYEFFHPDDVASVRESHQILLAQGEVSLVSYRIRCYNGEYIWFETTAHAVRDPSTGKVRELVAVSRDITSRKKAEVSLLERSHLSLLEAEVGKALGQGGKITRILQACSDAIAHHLNVTGVAIWTVSRKSTHHLELQVSSGRCEVEDCSKCQERINHHCLCLNFALVVEGRQVGMMEISSRYPLTEQVQNALYWIANAIAVGIDRVAALEELHSRREGLLFRLASQIRDSLDLNTILAKAVSEIRSLLQVDQCHFLWYLPTTDPRTSFVITHQAQSSSVPKSLLDYPADCVNWLSEKIEQHQMVQIDDSSQVEGFDGQTRAALKQAGVASMLFLPLETRSGQRGAIVCNHYHNIHEWGVSDVELLQAVVDQLAIAIDQAELYAQTRAAALAAQTQAAQLSQAFQDLQQKEAQLIQSEKMSSLGQMVAGIAHEINNPVNFIYGNLDYVRDYTQDLLEVLSLYQQKYPSPDSELEEKIEEVDLGFITEDLPKIIASMEMGADRIRQIVVSLRNFSRLDEAEMKPVDIHEGIDNTLLILHNRWKAKKVGSGVEIVKTYGKLPKVECYAGQLNQVFMNIISNAIDALDNQPDPRIVTICTELFHVQNPTESTNLPYVRVKIKDNGPGVSTAVKNRLFDPFFTTKPVGKGTGLGLSISYQIVVEKHGGSLQCFSEPGQGCEFWIEIPVEPPAELRPLD